MVARFSLPASAHSRGPSTSKPSFSSKPTFASKPKHPVSATPKYAVLIDGSALFLASRSLGEGKQLDYRALIDLLCGKVLGLTAPVANGNDSLWVMWTSAAPENAGQTRFLDFAERELHWTVRKFAPADSFMVEPMAAFGLTTDSRAVNRLVRFDASIAFAMGRLAESHRFVVVSDSFALAEPLLRSARLPNVKGQDNYLAFFGRALDSRWQRVLRTEKESAPQLIDLDEAEGILFGGQTKEVTKTALSDDFLLF